MTEKSELKNLSAGSNRRKTLLLDQRACKPTRETSLNLHSWAKNEGSCSGVFFRAKPISDGDAERKEAFFTEQEGTEHPLKKAKGGGGNLISRPPSASNPTREGNSLRRKKRGDQHEEFPVKDLFGGTLRSTHNSALPSPGLHILTQNLIGSKKKEVSQG